ncbi:protein AUXIN RESPONSE 4 isoform X1 [Canna indica]|uniref:Protein AUXIN RESPONSE 4 isoform X1 n=1 Tax=Canna indica TaxID=4628 RepID=A0AAQ3PZ43_9LILI|nr:protein AUXIN RESPONSE 4 isoform X1 [Canna indica]
MAESTSEIEGPKPSDDQPLPPPQPPDASPSSAPQHTGRRSSAASAFTFWAYLALFVSLIAVLLPSPSPSSDARSWFLSLPDDLRLHHARGKLIKAHAAASTLQVFAVEAGPPDGDSVLLLHGLGCSSFSFRRVLPSLASGGLRAVAVDLPGSGFSDPLPVGDRRWPFGWIGDVYSEIKEKGIFWAFDQLVETGQMPYDQIGVRVSGNDGDASSSYGPAEIGRVIGQVIDSIGLAPVHLVLHDSASPAALNWASANPGSVRSVTLIDSSAESAAFPSKILGIPVIGPLLLRSRFMFGGLLRLCCSRSMDESAAEAYRLLLKGKDGREAIVATGKALNFSFNLEEWTRLEAMKDVPLHVLWSNMWSDRWIDEGKRISAASPMGKFSYHSGGRWPQEDAPEEISGMIAQFLSSLPKLDKKKEEPLPEHAARLFDEATDTHHDHHHHHHHYHGHGHGHGHDHAAGYMDMYGVGQGWGI